MLRGSDFSVIVQGPILSSAERKGERDVTKACLASIRTFLPGAEIILATWKGAHTEGLDYDVLVESADPGAVSYRDDLVPALYNNINRQIVSTSAGLAAASRPYAVRFRGDLAFATDSILQYGDVLNAPLTTGLSHSRILISPFITHDPRRRMQLFHFSDIAQIGRIEDLRKFWSIPLAPEPETTRWSERQKDSFFSPQKPYCRVVPEQYMVLGWMAASGQSVLLNHPADISLAKVLLSEKTLLENFQVLELEQLGIRFPERLIKYSAACCYRNSDWKRLSAAYKRWPTRWLAQAGLLIRVYGIVCELILKKYIGPSSLQAFAPYRWLRDLYRRFFPLK